MKTVYLAGPMRNYPAYNFHAFHKATAHLRAMGFTVISPAEMDVEHGFDPIANPGQQPTETLAQCMARDLAAVAKCDMVAVLDGWEKSEGASIEVEVARRLKKGVIYADTLQPVTQTQPVQAGEVRVTDPTTGGQKGMKMERFDLIPVEPLEELARVYGRGAMKYADDNWRRGYDWKLSFGALMRHAWAFWRGESIDAETGRHHLACAAWHCFTLMWFERYKPEHDHRKQPSPQPKTEQLQPVSPEPRNASSASSHYGQGFSPP
jgi:nucleoside 2-deoxyribosyltransferase